MPRLHDALHRVRAAVRRPPRAPVPRPRTDDPAALNRLGDERLRLAREDEALACFLDAADGWARDGFYARSIAVYRKVLRLRPQHPQARERLAWTYWRSGLPIDAPR